MLRRTVRIITAVLLLSAVTVQFCFADGVNTVHTEKALFTAENVIPEIDTQYIGIQNVVSTLWFDRNVANCKILINVKSGKADKAILTVKLQKKSGSSYITVKNWREQTVGASASGRIMFQRTFAVSSHGTYRLAIEGKMYKGAVQVEAFEVNGEDVVY